MPYCPECGVELAENALSCPLCGKRIDEPRGSAHHHPREKFIDPDDAEKLSDRERRKIVWEALSVSAAIAGLAVAAINFLISGALSWSLYPLFSLAFLWAGLSGPLLFYSRPLLAAAFPALALPLFLLGIDLVDGALTWGLTIGVPIALDVELSLAVAYLIGRFSKRKGVNLIALALLAAASICLGIEAMVSLQLQGVLRFRWSAIVAVTLVPVAGFLFYIHYRVGKKTSLRKLFRL
ncbi:MAG: zinc ribbon domain-containing protein [Spirochaetaceae bacterium]|nr:zinc ribbon domain-containing protein [Spirochaetaceae bacterium]